MYLPRLAYLDTRETSDLIMQALGMTKPPGVKRTFLTRVLKTVEQHGESHLQVGCSWPRLHVVHYIHCVRRQASYVTYAWQPERRSHVLAMPVMGTCMAVWKQLLSVDSDVTPVLLLSLPDWHIAVKLAAAGRLLR